MLGGIWAHKKTERSSSGARVIPALVLCLGVLFLVLAFFLGIKFEKQAAWCEDYIGSNAGQELYNRDDDSARLQKQPCARLESLSLDYGFGLGLLGVYLLVRGACVIWLRDAVCSVGFGYTEHKDWDVTHL
jgi:hypothetical protein